MIEFGGRFFFTACFEAAIAISAIAVPFLLDLAGLVYAAVFGGLSEPPDASGAGQSLFYLTTTFLILAVPTACMGATLPLLTRYAVQSNEQVGPRTGALYALNTAGAIAGTLTAALLLLPALGLMGTIIFGAGVNLLVFVIAAGLSRASSDQSDSASEQTISHPRLGFSPEAWILPVMLISGVATFTYEVLWTRLLSHILGGSVIAFRRNARKFPVRHRNRQRDCGARRQKSTDFSIRLRLFTVTNCRRIAADLSAN